MKTKIPRWFRIRTHTCTWASEDGVVGVVDQRTTSGYRHPNFYYVSPPWVCRFKETLAYQTVYKPKQGVFGPLTLSTTDRIKSWILLVQISSFNQKFFL